VKITKQNLRRLIQEAIDDDPMSTVNLALGRSVQAVKQISQNNDVRTYEPSEGLSPWGKPREKKSRILIYQFMSTWAEHDDAAWNRSTSMARQAVLIELIELGAEITEPPPPMDDFGTPAVKFTLGGQQFELVTTGYRYDVEIYARMI
jgi:hypothetical protein|tara:strand:- start:1495 stop:1938 length:444 start_codon:yes stop_codon:yes gene_type:complete